MDKTKLKEEQFKKRVEIETNKYLNFCQRLLEKWSEGWTGDEKKDEKLFKNLKQKWKIKCDEVQQFNRYIRPDFRLFERAARSGTEEGMDTERYITAIEVKLLIVAKVLSEEKDLEKIVEKIKDIVFPKDTLSHMPTPKDLSISLEVPVVTEGVN